MKTDNNSHVRFLSFVFAASLASFGLVASGKARWTPGMDDDAGKAAATSSADLPAADFTGMRHIYPKRDRLFTTSLDGTWAFKLVKGLATPDELKGSFTIYAAELDAPPPDVVPDLTFTSHYGF